MFQRSMPPDLPRRFNQDPVFAPPFWLLQYIVLAHSWLSGNILGFLGFYFVDCACKNGLF